MKVLAPLLTGKENSDEFVEAISKGADKVIVLQVIDKEFMNKTSTAMGEVMQFSKILSEIKKKMGQKRKACDEITEWGVTTKKILAIAILQKVDKVVFVEQNNEFFKEITNELKKNKVKIETVKISEEKK